MKYFIREVLSEFKESQKKSAGSKARVDINEIFERELDYALNIVKPDGYNNKGISFKKIKGQFIAKRNWERAVACLQKDDVLFCQFPILVHSIFLTRLFKRLTKKGVKIIFVVHDLQWLRGRYNLFSKIRFKAEKKQLLCSYRLVTHNSKMSEYLCNLGFSKDKMIEIGIFDYLIPKYENKAIKKSAPIIIAGSLSKQKAGYLYSLPEEINWSLYGIGYEDKTDKHVKYNGSFSPEELPDKLFGSFGLVWDGNSCATCSGQLGEYLKINNPHKTSLYLASGVPVIIWEKAALADFVCKNNCGLTVSSLTDIKTILETISEEDYKKMCINAAVLGEKLRVGYYTKNMIFKCLE